MLKEHFDLKEQILVSQGKSVAITGHSLHKGTPREAFISEFLRDHLPASISIGTGEIIDSNSKAGEQRNQYDIVLYRNEYPKLNFGGGINAYLIESVVATLEVKSTLTYEDMKQAVKAAYNSKNLAPSINEIFGVPTFTKGIRNFLIAYDGPQNISTIYNWLKKAHEEHGITIPTLPNNPTRFSMPSPSLDAAFVLQKGFVQYDNFIEGLNTNKFRYGEEKFSWIYSDSANGNLLYLFHMLQYIIKSVNGSFLNATPYLNSAKYNINVT
ncbi:DUF6602 domain-containing protein [Pseudescherichia sp.]|uniref:DUF6602 domain-containing protein n=1 Tax=Pseudescherichia sp. TaxID=2055881 RepID=UPI00289BE671|nr:DUF6602 domain-containing protein [Pseudescherichia sp.]